MLWETKKGYPVSQQNTPPQNEKKIRFTINHLSNIYLHLLSYIKSSADLIHEECKTVS